MAKKISNNSMIQKVNSSAVRLGRMRTAKTDEQPTSVEYDELESGD